MNVLSIEEQSKNTGKLVLCEMVLGINEETKNSKLDLSKVIVDIQNIENDLYKQIELLKNKIVEDIRKNLKFFEKTQ